MSTSGSSIGSTIKGKGAGLINNPLTYNNKGDKDILLPDNFLTKITKTLKVLPPNKYKGKKIELKAFLI